MWLQRTFVLILIHIARNPHLDLGRPPLLGQGLDEAPVDATGDAAEPADG